MHNRERRDHAKLRLRLRAAKAQPSFGKMWIAGVLLALLASGCSGAPASDASGPASTAPSTESSTTTEAVGPPTVDELVADLLTEMTLAEKVGQMTLVENGSITPEQVSEFFIGGVLSGGNGAPSRNAPDSWVKMTTSYQEAALATRLKIPLIYGVDAVHGHSILRGATVFPHNIGLGAAGSPELAEEIGRVTAIETAATGIPWTYSPVLAVVQDPRWGRTYESFGSDPQMVSALGAALVRGLQGEDLAASDTVLATPKHFAADGAAEWGTSTTEDYKIDQGDTQIDEQTLREVHVAPYIESLDAGALSVMASYTSWQGEKVHGRADLLTDLLKGELEFDGFLVSDWGGVDQIDPANYYNSVVIAINAGVDLNMVPTNYEVFITAVTTGVANGDIPIERIDDAVERILRTKLALGLFDRPFPDPELAAKIRAPEHVALAAEAVVQSQVLLVNDGATLPIDASTVFVGGAGARDLSQQSGGWTLFWQGSRGLMRDGSTILDGVEQLAGAQTSVIYDRFGKFDNSDDPERAEVGIVVIGEQPYAEGIGDSATLALDEFDIALVERMRPRVDSLVIILLSGRPLILDPVLDLGDVIVASWLPGSEGNAVARPLFGEAEFTGSLPLAWPRSVDQLPFPIELTDDPCSSALFPAGHGLASDQSFRPARCEMPREGEE